MPRIKKQLIFSLIILLLLSTVPLLWFKRGYDLIDGYDFAMYLRPLREFSENTFLWRDRLAPGYDNTASLPVLFFYGIFALPALLGLDLYSMEKIVYVFLFALCGLSMYYMSRVIFSNEEKRGFIATIAAIFYMFNFANMAKFGRGELLAILVQGIFPFCVGIFISANKERKLLKYAFLLGLFSIAFCSTLGHPADFALYLLTFVFFLVFFFSYSNSEEKVFTAKFTIVSVIIIILLNLWWILPILRYALNYDWQASYLKERHGFIDTVRLVSDYSSASSLLRLFQLKNFVLWFDVVKYGKKIWGISIYETPIFTFLGLLFPVFAYSSFLFKKRNKYVFFFGILGMAGIFLAKGTHPPLGYIYEWMYLNIPGFMVFRVPWRIFLMLVVFAWAPLIGFSCARITHKVEQFNRKISKSVGLITVTIIFLYVWPMFSAAHLREKGENVQTGVYVNLPDYYSRASQWLDSQPNDFSIYNPLEAYDITTDWGYHGKDLTARIFNPPQFIRRSEDVFSYMYQRPIASINHLLKDYKYADLSKILGGFNIKYVILQKDLHFWSFPFPNFNSIVESLLKINDIDLKGKFGPLEFYEVKNNLPLIYATNNASFLTQGWQAIPRLSLSRRYIKPCLFFIEENRPEQYSDLIDKLNRIIISDTRKAEDKYDNLDLEREYLLTVRHSLDLAIARAGTYMAAALALPDLKAITKSGFSKKINSLDDFEAFYYYHNVVSPSQSSYQDGCLKISFANSGLIKVMNEVRAQIKIQPALDLTRYPVIILNLGVDDSEGQAIGLDIGLDLNNDDLIDRHQIIPALAFSNQETDKIGINLYQLASEEFGPQDCFRVIEVGFLLKTNDLNKSFYFREIIFEGEFGISLLSPGPQTTRVKINENEYKLELGEDNQWFSFGPLDLRKGTSRIEFGDQPFSYLLHLSPLPYGPDMAEPKIYFRKVNPTKYLIDAESSRPYFLVFSQSYHPGWQAYIENQIVTGHYKVNGFANAYYIDKIGKHKITLEFYPQRLFIWGLMVSTLSLLIMLILWIKKS